MSFWNRLFRPPKPDRFSRLVRKVFQASGVASRIQYDPEHFKLTIEEGQSPKVVFLSNMYQEYCKAPFGKRLEIIQRYARAFTSQAARLPDSLDEARPNLLPHLRDRAFHGITRLQLELQGVELHPIPTRLFTDHLAFELVYDCPEHVMSVPVDQLEHWGITLDEALAIARDNLWKISNQEFLKVQPGLFASPWHDAHDASRLLLHDLIWQLPVKGDHIAMVPHRDLLLVTGSDDEAGLLKMAQIAASEMNGTRLVSGIPVHLRGTTWEPFIPGDDHPAASHLRHLRLEMTARDYEQQKQILEELHKKQRKDIFVASCMIMQPPWAQELLFSVWPEGVDTLLPHTDHVALYAEWLPKGTQHQMPEWDRVAGIAGELMQPMGLYPERYRVQSFPTREQLARLGVFEQ
jgi:uncharacterized protein YtpQ (UPF0354 family)